MSSPGPRLRWADITGEEQRRDGVTLTPSLQILLSQWTSCMFNCLRISFLLRDFACEHISCIVHFVCVCQSEMFGWWCWCWDVCDGLSHTRCQCLEEYWVPIFCQNEEPDNPWGGTSRLLWLVKLQYVNASDWLMISKQYHSPFENHSWAFTSYHERNRIMLKSEKLILQSLIGFIPVQIAAVHRQRDRTLTSHRFLLSFDKYSFVWILIIFRKQGYSQEGVEGIPWQGHVIVTNKCQKKDQKEAFFAVTNLCIWIVYIYFDILFEMW